MNSNAINQFVHDNIKCVDHSITVSGQVTATFIVSLMQSKLNPKVQEEIVSELKTMQQLREVLDVVEIVMGFLSSGGANADKNLHDYIRNALRMGERFISKKVSLQFTA